MSAVLHNLAILLLSLLLGLLPIAEAAWAAIEVSDSPAESRTEPLVTPVRVRLAPSPSSSWVNIPPGVSLLVPGLSGVSADNPVHILRLPLHLLLCVWRN
ncbi:MAG: hypothetical protein U0840_21435 [Gemmataceae bacterium]